MKGPRELGADCSLRLICATKPIPGEALHVDCLVAMPHNFSLPHSGIGSALMASAYIEGCHRRHGELELFAISSAVSFYQTLGMDILKSDADPEDDDCLTFSLNLAKPLPSRLETVISKIYTPLKKRKLSDPLMPPLKRLCARSIPEEAPKR